MNQRFDNESVGLAWVLRVMGWVALMGSVLVAAPIGLLFGETAGSWALGAVGTVALTTAWLSVEALRAWHGPERAEAAEPAPVPSQS